MTTPDVSKSLTRSADAHRWSETGMAIYGDRRKINPGDRRRTNPGERRWSGGPCPIGEYRCASVVPNSCLVARRSRLPEGLVITTGRAPRTVGWARQTRERAAVTKPACTMRPIAKPRRPTGLLPAPQGCGTRHSKQDSTQMQKGYTLNTRMGLGPARRFTADTAQPNPGSPRRGGCCLRVRSGTIESIGAGHSSLCHGRAWPGQPRLCCWQQEKT